MISIIIATANRSHTISACIQSIERNTYQNFEIIIIDQSPDNNTHKIVQRTQDIRIRYYRQVQTNKSRALNFGITKSKGSTLVFTDDDCIVDKFWLKNIIDTYKKYPDISGVFGNTYPYKPRLHRNQQCVGHFISKSLHTSYNYQTLHYLTVGIGNNMSIKRRCFDKKMTFTQWLSPGTFFNGGEDSDIIYQLLKSKHTLLTNPAIIVYHDHWLNEFENEITESIYTRSFCAFYLYHIINGDFILIRPLSQIIWKKLITPLQSQYHAIQHSGLRGFFYIRYTLIYLFFQSANILIGIFLGLYYNLKFRIIIDN